MSTLYTSDLGSFTVVEDVCWFEIDGVPSSAGADAALMAWDCPNPMALLKPDPLRNGGGLVVPGAGGRLPRRRKRDAFDAVLRFEVYDRSDPFGETEGDPATNFYTNLMFLRANLGAEIPAPYTRTCTVHAVDGSIWSGDVQVEVDWADDIAPPLGNVAVTVTVLNGLTELESS